MIAVWQVLLGMSEAEDDFVRRHLEETSTTGAAHGFLSVEWIKATGRFIPKLPRTLSGPGKQDRVPGVGSFGTAEEAARARGRYLFHLQNQLWIRNGIDVDLLWIKTGSEVDQL